jgi:hypothetical protein
MLQLKTPATDYPITVDELKSHLRYLPDDDSQDDRLTSLIAAAVNFIEQETNRAYVQQTWILLLPHFPHVWHDLYNARNTWYRPYADQCRGSQIILPRPPLVSVTEIKYYDTANSQQTLDTSEYRMIAGTNAPGLVEPINAWPQTHWRTDAVSIEFVAGYSDGETSTPPELVKHAIKLLAGAWDQNRESEVIGTSIGQSNLGIDRILGLLSVGTYV